MILITHAVLENLLDFIIPRKGIPPDVEQEIINKQKKCFYDTLLDKNIINHEALLELKEIIKKEYYSRLIQPGETVGIICGQCIGEKTTQSSLNNFHSAGLDTGTNSQIDNLQNIINASKIKKRDNKKFFTTTLYTIENLSLVELKTKTSHYLNEIKLGDIILRIENPDIIKNQIVLYLCLEKIFTWKISRNILFDKLGGREKLTIPPFSSLDKSDTSIKIIFKLDEFKNFFNTLKNLKETTLVGISGVKSHIFTKENELWCIKCTCANLSVFLDYGEIYDLNKIYCDSIYEMYNHLGVLATKEFIIIKCKNIIPDINPAHFKILSTRMTKNGTIEPLTRYTMRSNTSPLSKASFEESFETFLKACKFKEVENFKSISSSIICGKKPKIGTYTSDILINHQQFI